MCRYTNYQKLQNGLNRLNPITEVINFPNTDTTVSTVPNFENTKHRYSWICSIRDPIRNGLIQVSRVLTFVWGQVKCENFF